MPRRRPAPSSLYESLDDLLLRTERPTLFVPAAAAEPGAVALLSGSFDPITIGHAALVDTAADRADLVLLVYSVRTLPKEGPASSPLLSERDRLRALEAFVQDRQRVIPALVSHGLLAEQAEAARRRFPAARLVLVMGSDKALQVLDPKWYVHRDEVLGPVVRPCRRPLHGPVRPRGRRGGAACPTRERAVAAVVRTARRPAGRGRGLIP